MSTRLKLSTQTLQRLHALAAKNGVSREEMIRRALDVYSALTKFFAGDDD